LCAVFFSFSLDWFSNNFINCIFFCNCSYGYCTWSKSLSITP